MPEINFIKLKPNVNNYSKSPEPAIAARAEWWKKMDKYQKNEKFPYPRKDFANIKACPVVDDSINFGYILYFPVDVFIDATDSENIYWNLPDVDLSVFDDGDQGTFINYHSPSQLEGYPHDKNYHKVPIKINTLWGIKTEPGYSVWITTPILRPDLPFKIIDAVVDTDSITTIFAYSFFIKNNFKGVIKSGTPFIQVIPFKREDFQKNIREKDYEELNKSRNSTLGFFTGGYRKIHWKRKKFL
jgi:hypothetical protein